MVSLWYLYGVFMVSEFTHDLLRKPWTTFGRPAGDADGWTLVAISSANLRASHKSAASPQRISNKPLVNISQTYVKPPGASQEISIMLRFSLPCAMHSSMRCAMFNCLLSQGYLNYRLQGYSNILRSMGVERLTPMKIPACICFPGFRIGWLKLVISATISTS